MATAEQYVRKLATGSDLHLAQATGGRNSELNHFLLPYSFDRVLFEDQFSYKTFNVTDYWTTNAGTGATAFAVPGTPGNGGTITCATGTNGTGSNRRVNLYGPPIYLGDQFLMMEVRLKTSSNDNLHLEAGFIDTMTSITTPAPALTDVDVAGTWAGGLGDAAIFTFNDQETKNTAYLGCLGSGALNTGTVDAIGSWEPTDDTYFVLRVGIVGNTAFASINRDGITNFAQRASGVEGGTLVRPWIFVGGVNATSKTITISRVRILMNEPS